MKKVDFVKVEALLKKVFIEAAKKHGSMRDVLKGDKQEVLNRLKKKVAYRDLTDSEKNG